MVKTYFPTIHRDFEPALEEEDPEDSGQEYGAPKDVDAVNDYSGGQYHFDEERRRRR